MLYKDCGMDRQDLLDTAWENTENILNCILCEKSVEEFLHRDNPVVLRSTNLSRIEQDVHLNINLDTDGIVLGLHSLNAVKFNVRHVSFFDNNIYKLKSVYNLLKKHLILPKYKQSINVLKKARGFQLFYENGWECYLTLLPNMETKFGNFADNEILSLFTSYFNKLCTNWKSELRDLALQNMCINTLQKNSLSLVNRLHILPGDQYHILKALDNGITHCPTPYFFHAYLFVFRFGERAPGSIDIEKDFDLNLVKDQSLHIAATLRGNYDLGLFWSRQGLQSIVGQRGCLSTCLSFSEAANFQSNLDERYLDVSPKLRKLVVCPSRINFLQFYGDIAHVYPATRHHSVSGSIVNCGLLNANTLKALEKDAIKYIAACKDNILLLKQLKCRLEYVISPTEIIGHVDPSKLFVLESLLDLLDNEPLIVPFDQLEGSLCDALQEVGLYITYELEKCFMNGRRLGTYKETWISFQSELAIEKFIWGKPINLKHPGLAVNLGPGLMSPSRSKTDWLGFLALDDSTSTTIEDSPPPLDIWVSSPKVSSEISNLFGYYDFINSCNAVLGSRSILILLRDLLELVKGMRDDTSFNCLLANLKSTDVSNSYICNGVINLSQLVTILTNAKGVSSRLGTRRMYSILFDNSKDVKEILKAGLLELGLKMFPGVKTYDASRHNNLTWNGCNLWKILPESGDPEIDDDYCQACSQIIINYLGSNNYVHWTKLIVLQRSAFQFPWVKPILRKLTHAKLQTKEKENILLFCSCVALLANGWYVDYRKISRLLEEMPLTQFQLKGMEIQSTKLLGVISTPKIWRLHQSIPVKLNVPERRTVPNVVNPEVEQTNKESTEYRMKESILEPDTGNENDVVRTPMRHHTACANKTWSGDEIELLERVKGDQTLATLKLKYKRYQNLCLAEEIPDRTFKAFSRKISRI